MFVDKVQRLIQVHGRIPLSMRHIVFGAIVWMDLHAHACMHVCDIKQMAVGFSRLFNLDYISIIMAVDACTYI